MDDTGKISVAISSTLLSSLDLSPELHCASRYRHEFVLRRIKSCPSTQEYQCFDGLLKSTMVAGFGYSTLAQLTAAAKAS